MRAILILTGLVGAFALATVASAEDGKPGKRDAEAVLKRLDANSDGKISMEEFKKLGERAKGKAKDNPELMERFFKRLDANGDGSLSRDELKKLAELRGKRSGK